MEEMSKKGMSARLPGPLAAARLLCAHRRVVTQLMLALCVLACLASAFGQGSSALNSAPAGARLVRMQVSLKIHSKTKARVKLNMNPATLIASAENGQPAPFVVPVTNLMNARVSVKEIAVEGSGSSLSLPGGAQREVLLAPGESYEIAAVVIARKGSGRARIRVVASEENSRHAETKHIDVSYKRVK